MVRNGYTKRGHEWLKTLSGGKSCASGFGNAAYRCRKNGWCDWDRDSEGKALPGYYEVITQAGIEKLAEWDSLLKAQHAFDPKYYAQKPKR